MAAKKDNIYKHAEIILKRMIDRSGLSQNLFAEKVLGIKSVNMTRARQSGKIPDSWFDAMLEKYGMTKEELCQPPVIVKARALVEHRYGITDQDLDQETKEEEPPMVRHYRELAVMDSDTLGEIQTWINDMERFRPGFKSWFRLEFQNRFPEFDDWKNRMIKKQAGNGN